MSHLQVTCEVGGHCGKDLEYLAENLNPRVCPTDLASERTSPVPLARVHPLGQLVTI